MFIFMNKKSSLTVIKFLIEHGGDRHVREISRKTKLSVGFVSRVLHEFLKDDLVSVQRKGRMKLYKIKDNNPIVKQIKILITVTKLYPLIKKLRHISRRIILFGSASRGEDVPESDIDLFIFTGNSQKVRTILSKNPKVAPIIMNSMEFANLKNNDFALYEQINRGIILWEKSE
jgi:predicted nucleotidyltransferase